VAAYFVRNRSKKDKLVTGSYQLFGKYLQMGDGKKALFGLLPDILPIFCL